jgi:hypothetical protein
MGEKRYTYRVLVGKLRERVCLEDLDVDGTIILNYILIEKNGRA